MPTQQNGADAVQEDWSGQASGCKACAGQACAEATCCRPRLCSPLCRPSLCRHSLHNRSSGRHLLKTGVWWRPRSLRCITAVGGWVRCFRGAIHACRYIMRSPGAARMLLCAVQC